MKCATFHRAPNNLDLIVSFAAMLCVPTGPSVIRTLFYFIDLYRRMPIIIRLIFVIMSRGTKNVWHRRKCLVISSTVFVDDDALVRFCEWFVCSQTCAKGANTTWTVHVNIVTAFRLFHRISIDRNQQESHIDNKMPIDTLANRENRHRLCDKTKLYRINSNRETEPKCVSPYITSEWCWYSMRLLPMHDSICQRTRTKREKKCWIKYELAKLHPVRFAIPLKCLLHALLLLLLFGVCCLLFCLC